MAKSLRRIKCPFITIFRLITDTSGWTIEFFRQFRMAELANTEIAQGIIIQNTTSSRDPNITSIALIVKFRKGSPDKFMSNRAALFGCRHRATATAKILATWTAHWNTIFLFPATNTFLVILFWKQVYKKFQLMQAFSTPVLSFIFYELLLLLITELTGY